MPLLPLAVTRADDAHARVGAVTPDGTWVHPEPVAVADVESPDTVWRSGHWTAAALTPS